MKRFLIFFLICFFMFLPWTFAAIEGDGWYEKNVQNVITSSRFVNWHSESSYDLITTQPFNLATADGEIIGTASIPYNNAKVHIAGAGYSFQLFMDQQLKVDYLYSIETFMCTDNLSGNIYELLFQLGSGTNPNESMWNEPVYSYASISEISPFYTNKNHIVNFSQCFIITSLISPSVNGSWFDVRLRSNTNVSANVYLLGYSTHELGIYNESLENTLNNIVKNSGLASATSVAQVQTSVNQVKTELNNVNSSIEDQTQQQEQNHQETMNTITSSDVDSPDSTFSQFESYLPENGVITQLITLPISLFQKVLTSINGSCNQYNLGNLMGTDLTLPCINISNYIGTTLWNVIDVLFSGFFVLVIAKKMIKVFNNFSSMEEGDVLD